MAQQQQPPKLAGVRERARTVTQRAGTARIFVVVLIVLLAILLIVGNWAPIRISVWGTMFDVPGILWYVLLFACGALVGIWLEGRWRAQ